MRWPAPEKSAGECQTRNTLRVNKHQWTEALFYFRELPDRAAKSLESQIVLQITFQPSERGNSRSRVGYGRGVTGLSVKDIHVLEDGIEQQVKNVAIEPYRVWGILDNVYGHLSRQGESKACAFRGFGPRF